MISLAHFKRKQVMFNMIVPLFYLGTFCEVILDTNYVISQIPTRVNVIFFFLNKQITKYLI